MQPLKYIFAGIANTVIGYGVFLILVTLFNMNPAYANAIGYGVALIAAFLFNKTFVFSQSTTDRSTIPKFVLAFAISFTLNQLVLMIVYRWIGVHAEVAQIFAMASYTIAFYLLNKEFVFNKPRTEL
ncbi:MULTISPECIES: GtrA family protein [Pseudomonas]|uniref:GtrA/DPMS transmembrane domain-containing protein n=1 Tax=Pseudomonas fluorescens TaxID=294 RepID=A0A162BHN0_PSEFL|nr:MULTISPECIES: GtrA family protein [Pseudomonas]KZN15803.1 hypothetical protein A1D17_06350 [Pseudomonas fluorescens]